MLLTRNAKSSQLAQLPNFWSSARLSHICPFLYRWDREYCASFVIEVFGHRVITSRFGRCMLRLQEWPLSRPGRLGRTWILLTIWTLPVAQARIRLSWWLAYFSRSWWQLAKSRKTHFWTLFHLEHCLRLKTLPLRLDCAKLYLCGWHRRPSNGRNLHFWASLSRTFPWGR